MKQHSLKSVLPALTALLVVVACQKDPIENPNTLPPQQEFPNPLPANALAKKLVWSENDHQTFTYNPKGQVARLTSQWQYVEGDPTKIRVITYDFQYDAQDRPVQVNTTGGFSVKYYYNGDLVEKTEELYPGGAVAKEVAYVYDNGRLIRENWRVSGLPGEPDNFYRHVFSYDAKGNLNKITTYERMANLQYKLLQISEYGDFDDKINPTSWMLRYPFLPQARYQYNNPRREVLRSPGGVAETTVHAYKYDDQGRPYAKRTMTPSGGELSMAYQY